MRRALPSTGMARTENLASLCVTRVDGLAERVCVGSIVGTRFGEKLLGRTPLLKSSEADGALARSDRQFCKVSGPRKAPLDLKF